MSSGYYKQSSASRETLYAIFTLSRDVEITVFGEDGRDITFKGKAGDDLVMQQDGYHDWFPIECYPPGEIDDAYEPIGDV